MNTKKMNQLVVGDRSILMIFKRYLLRKIIAKIFHLRGDFPRGIMRAKPSLKCSR